MSTHPPDVSSTTLAAGAAEAHGRALDALEHPEADGAGAVAWCSAHLAAVDQVLYAAARRRVPDGARLVHVARGVDRRLQAALCRLDRRLTGSVHVSDVPLRALSDEVRHALRRHDAVEQQLLRGLTEALAPAELQELCERTAHAMESAPTRPHPHTRHTPLAALVARVDAWVDRGRDLMDNREVPTPRVRRAARRPGPWGCYLMGVPYPDEQVRSRQRARPHGG
jgi:hypothetical protein